MGSTSHKPVFILSITTFVDLAICTGGALGEQKSVRSSTDKTSKAVWLFLNRLLGAMFEKT